MDHMTAPTFIRLMRAHRVTIRELALRAGISHKRIREIRRHGISNALDTWGWGSIITGNTDFSWYDVAKVYQGRSSIARSRRNCHA